MKARAMTAGRVHALVRSVIVMFALPFAVMSVYDSLAGWRVTVRAGTGEYVRFTLAGGPAEDMRWEIRRMLEAER